MRGERIGEGMKCENGVHDERERGYGNGELDIAGNEMSRERESRAESKS